MDVHYYSIMLCFVCALQSPERHERGSEVIAVKPDAVLYSSTASDARIVDRRASAKLLAVRKSEGRWLFVGSGWIPADDVVSVDKALIRFGKSGDGSAWIRATRSRCLFAVKRFQEATAEADACLRLNRLEPAAHVTRGAIQFERGEYHSAIPELSTAISLGSTDLQAYEMRALALAQTGNVDAALADLDFVLARDDANNTALATRGALRVMLGRFDAAIEDLNRAITIDPADAISYKNRGAAWASKQNYVQALHDIDASLRIDPKNAGAYANRGVANRALGNFHESLSDFNRAIELAPRDAQSYCNRAMSYSALGQQAQAMADYNDAVELQPHDARFVRARGNAWLAAGNLDEALADFTRAIRINAADPASFVNRGNALYRAGRPSEALNDLATAIRLGDSSGLAYRNRAVILNDRGDFEGAIRDLEVALKANPEDLVAHRECVVALMRSGKLDTARSHLSSAIEKADAKISKAPDAEALFFRAEFHSLAGRSRAALDDYSESLKLNRDDPDVLAARGCVLARLWRFQEALQDFDASLKADEDADVYFQRSGVLCAVGDPVSAKNDADAGLRLKGGSSFGHVCLACACADLGDYRSATKEFDVALGIDSESALANAGLAWVLATCPEAGFRDGTRSLELANRARVLWPTEHPYFMMVLASACAEKGDFAGAVQWQSKAIQGLDPNRPEVKEAITILERYRSQKPLRQRKGGILRPLGPMHFG